MKYTLHGKFNIKNNLTQRKWDNTKCKTQKVGAQKLIEHRESVSQKIKHTKSVIYKYEIHINSAATL